MQPYILTEPSNFPVNLTFLDVDSHSRVIFIFELILTLYKHSIFI